MVAANDHLFFHGMKMSEAIFDVEAYTELTDDVFQQILHSSGDEMEMVQYCLLCLQLQLMCTS